MNFSAKIAVVGSGYWGKNLVRNFNNLGSLHTICDTNPATLEQLDQIDGVVVPEVPADLQSVWAQFSLLSEKRQGIQDSLKS